MKKQIICFFTAVVILISTFSMNVFSVGDVIDFSRDNITLYSDQTYQLTLKSDASAENYSSSDPDIVSVGPNGLVTAKSAGISTITATDSSGNQATCTITVRKGTSPQSVELETQLIQMTEGESKKLNAKVLPEDTEDARISFFSSDESVAKIDSEGNIRALKAGVSVITAESASSAVSNKCMVKVASKKGRSGYESSINGTLYTLAGDKKANMAVELKNSSDTLEATTDIEGKFTFEDIAQGSYTINIYKKAGDKSAVASGLISVESYRMDVSCIINGKELVCLYQNDSTDTVPGNDLFLSKGSIELDVGSSYDIVFKVEPANASVPKITGKSRNEDIAVVDSDGRITAISEGTTTIVFTSSDGRFEKFCNVKVNAPAKNTNSWIIITVELSLIVLVIVLFFIAYRRFIRNKERREGFDPDEKE